MGPRRRRRPLDKPMFISMIIDMNDDYCFAPFPKRGRTFQRYFQRIPLRENLNVGIIVSSRILLTSRCSDRERDLLVGAWAYEGVLQGLRPRRHSIRSLIKALLHPSAHIVQVQVKAVPLGHRRLLIVANHESFWMVYCSGLFAPHPCFRHTYGRAPIRPFGSYFLLYWIT